MFHRLYISSFVSQKVDSSFSSVISKKIYKKDSNKTKAFLFSLLLHSTLLAAFFHYSPKRVVEPIEAEKKMMVSLLAPQSVSKPQELAKPVITPKKTEPFLQAKKIKPVVKKKKVVKKKIAKVKKVIKKEPVIKPTPELVKEDKTLEKELIVATNSLTPSEVLTPQASPMPTTSKTKTKTEEKVSKKESTQSISASTLGEIRSLIQNSLVYPAIARRMKIEGIVVVSFVLTQDGRVESANILTRSGSSSLDKKALKTVLALSGQYPHLKKKLDLQIPISFSLKNS